jgi:hypothetical protein
MPINSIIFGWIGTSLCNGTSCDFSLNSDIFYSETMQKMYESVGSTSWIENDSWIDLTHDSQYYRIKLNRLDYINLNLVHQNTCLS